jgi:HlyD family secretion protein
MSSPTRRPSRGIANSLVVLIVLAIAAVVGGVLVFRGGGGQETASTSGDLWTVRTGSFEITVPAAGELAAASQVEIASQLERRAVITEIVPEGTFVRQGDRLIHLDDEEIVNLIKEEELAVENAAAALTAAESALEVRKLTGESALSLAEVDVRLAKTALESWQEGEDKSRQQQLALDLETAEKDFARLEERFAASELLLEQQFISEDEFKRDEIELLRASSRLEQARLAKVTYDKYDRSMQLERLNADIQRANDKLRETRERQEREIEAQEREVQNRSFQLIRKREDLEKARGQLEMCYIYAPQDGLVVYASSLSRDRRGGDEPPEVGTELRRNRTVIVLPDTTRMVAEVKVNEALSGRIRPGQKASVRVDAMPNVPLAGSVLGVGVLAESGGWRDPNRRDYTVRIAIDADPEMGLKPSMRARSQIEVGSVQDALHVPIQSVFRDGRLAYVWTQDGTGFSPKPVQLGRASELMIEIRGGLESGEQVLLREPRADEIVRSIDELKQEIEAQRAEARESA